MSQHPLQLYPVLKTLGKQVGFRELLAFRQVCSAWKVEADHRLQDRIKIKLASSEDLKRFVDEVSTENNMNLLKDFELENIILENCMQFFTTFGSSIHKLKLTFCHWRSSSLRIILFKRLPHLRELEISTDKNNNDSLEPLLPMSRVPYGTFSPLVNLKELKISGDYSSRTDLFYDLLKSSPNLEIIRLAKHDPSADDLFGTWLTEIILSSEYPCLQCLELECSLIQQQIHSIISRKYPLKRLCIDLDLNGVELTTLDNVLEGLGTLESVEFGIENANNVIVENIINRYKRYNYRCWIALHTTTGSKIIFPRQAHVLES